MTIILTILASILVFGSVIFIHELGHFMVAKKCGIKVNEFAIGMGPRLFKIVRGETTYAIRLLPIGGFVSMEGEDEESDDSRSFTKAKVWKRLLVIVAGAFMNLVLGFFICLCLVSFAAGISFSQAPVWVLVLFGLLGVAFIAVIVLGILKKLSGKKVGWSLVGILLVAFVLLFSFCAKGGVQTKVVAQFTAENSITEQTGLQIGDEILKVNGRSCFLVEDIQYELSRVQLDSVNLTVRRDGKVIELDNVKFENSLAEDGKTVLHDLGFKVFGVHKTFSTVVRGAFDLSIYMVRSVYIGLYDLLTGNVAINQMSGPVGIIDQVSQAVQIGWTQVFTFMALISINLGIMNMLPFPALDGGKAVLLIIEAIRRKPIKQKYEIIINLVGLGLLLLLMLFVSFNDVVRIFFSK